MYGLPQAGIFANKLLKQRLSDEGWHEQPHTPGLFKYERKTCVTLAVDNLGIKYGNHDDTNHLVGVLVLEDHHDIKIDWRSVLYYGIMLQLCQS